MTVDLFMVGLGGYDLSHRVAVGTDNAGEIHHFCQTQNPGMVKETVHILVVQIGTALIQRGSGHTGGDHKPYIHRKILGCRQHVVDAGGVHHIGDLVGIGDDGGGAVGNHRPGKFSGAYQTGFQMDMGINESGADDPPGHIHFPNALILAQTHNEAMGNGDVLGHQFAGKHIHIGGVFQHQVRLFPAGRHIDDLLLLNELPADLTGPAFLLCHRHFLHTLSFYDTTAPPVYKTKNRKPIL